MKNTLFLLLVLVSAPALRAQQIPEMVTRIAFGSCAHQDKRLPALQKAADQMPNVFIFMGDNIYGDTEDMALLKEKYGKLGMKKEFQNLLKTCPILATWDDHDYGANDSGLEYPQKEASKEVFMDFWKEPLASSRRVHEGIYTSYLTRTAEGKLLQIILLDTRTFRTPLAPANKANGHDMNDYCINPDTAATMLGKQQWDWLRGELSKPADIRLIGSSTQFAVEYNGYEAWANFPLEQQKMLDLIAETQAKGVFFISGDVHYAELNRIEQPGRYPIYDLTSSGISEEWSHVERSQNRLGKAVQDNNFGLIDILAKEGELYLVLQVFDKKGKLRIKEEVKVDALK